jgi:hypothetical protein
MSPAGSRASPTSRPSATPNCLCGRPDVGGLADGCRRRRFARAGAPTASPSLRRSLRRGRDPGDREPLPRGALETRRPRTFAGPGPVTRRSDAGLPRFAGRRALPGARAGYGNVTSTKPGLGLPNWTTSFLGATKVGGSHPAQPLGPPWRSRRPPAAETPGAGAANAGPLARSGRADCVEDARLCQTLTGASV